ncbi:MAG: hypothetical protein ACLFVQ_12210 [Chitinispirillaceae bacterium]
MIRINLAKSNDSKGVFGSQKTRMALVAFVCLVVVAGLAGTAFYIFRSTPSKQVAVASDPVDTTAPKPSSHIRPNMIENVVKEIRSGDRSVKRFNISYEDMTVAEKINYEVLFGRNVLELVGRSVPAGIQLVSLEIEGFQSMYASGLGSSRELVSEMFSNFKSEPVEVLPLPLSNIKDDPIGYRFVITCKTKFGLELSDAFQALDHLGFQEGLSVHLKSFSRLAEQNSVNFRSSPRRVSVERVGDYRRVIYRAEGESTYRDFHQFVLALYNEKVPCAFKKISLDAKSGTTIKVATEVLFTVKN